MRQLSKKQKFAAAGAAAIITVAASGTAYAYFSSSGTGDGVATTGTSSALTVVAGPPSGSALLPGSGSQTVSYKVHNPGAASQSFTTVAAKVANLDGSPWTAVPGCSAADYTLVNTPPAAAPVAANGDSAAGSVVITMNETGVSQDGCKNAPVPLHFSAS